MSRRYVNSVFVVFNLHRLSFLVVSFIFAPLMLLSFGVPHEITKQYAQSDLTDDERESGIHDSLMNE